MYEKQSEPESSCRNPFLYDALKQIGSIGKAFITPETIKRDIVCIILL